MGILTSIVLVPALAVFVILLIPARRLRLIKQVCLVATGITVILAIWLVIDFLGKIGLNGTDHPAGTALALQYVEQFRWLGSNLHIDYFLGVDGISVLMILLTAVVIFCGVCASWNHDYRVQGVLRLPAAPGHRRVRSLRRQ